MKLILKKRLLIILVLFIAISSCRSTDTENRIEAQGRVKVNIMGIEYFDTTIIGLKESPEKKTYTKTERKVLQINNNLAIISELIPIANSAKNDQNTSITSGLEDLKSGTRYKIVIYDEGGVYLMERDYVRGQERENDLSFNLNSDDKYTFIIYTVGSSTEIPSITYSNPSNKTLRSSVLSNISTNTMLAYFRKDIIVSGKEVNNIDVVLRHKFSEISTNIMSPDGKEIKEIKAAITPSYKNVNLQLSDGNIIYNGEAQSNSIEFKNLNANTINGKVIISSDASNGSLIVPSITMGTETFTDLTLYKDLKIFPGMRYQLNIIVNTDAYLVHMGQPSVRINGMIWMRHNLGANTSIDPDQIPSVKELHGNYYQWGRIDPVGNAESNLLDTKAKGYNTDANALNNGTEQAPIKTTNDPCPKGFRVPTSTEFQKLANAVATQAKPENGWSESITNYKAAFVLTSKLNSSINMTLPATGALTNFRRNFDRGNYFSYLTTNKDKIVFVYGRIYEFNILDTRVSNTGRNIRCIAE
ncbi:TPA: FISUMP domain-containing protein [Elizabethkingia anophelis]